MASSPGAVNGPRIDAVIAAKAQMLDLPADQVSELYLNQSSLGRLIEAEDIANMVAFFVGESAGYVSGQVIYVAGGPKA